MKRLVSLGTCLTLSLVFVFGFGTARSTLPASAQGEYVIFPETASVSSSGVTPLNFMLKAISKPSGDVEKVSGFKIDPLNVLSVSASGVISTISTDESMVFEQAKAKSSTDSLYELQKATIQGQQQPPSPQQPSNGFSIAGLAPGVYTLDLIGTKNGAKAAYEGILIIGQDKESPQVKQVVEKEINEVQQDTTIIDIVTIFQTPPQVPQQPQTQPQLLPTGPIAQLLPPSGTLGPLGAQPQQSAAIPLGGQGQPLSLLPSPSPSPSPQPQALAAQPGQCQPGFEGVPPQCTPIEPGSEPIDLLSLDPSTLDPNDPLFGEPGGLGDESGEGEETKEVEDSDEGDSNAQGGGNNGGDEGDSDSGGDGGGDSEGDSDSGGGGEE